MQEYRVKEISQEDERTLSILWTDNKRQNLDVLHLRRECPCASCCDEHTGKRTLDPASVSEDVRPRTLQSVGKYALSISFSDGHSSGIYTFDKLRKLDS